MSVKSVIISNTAIAPGKTRHRIMSFCREEYEILIEKPQSAESQAGEKEVGYKGVLCSSCQVERRLLLEPHKVSNITIAIVAILRPYRNCY